jgi:hypothetical protein
MPLEYFLLLLVILAAAGIELIVIAKRGSRDSEEAMQGGDDQS